jgi:predicted O-methyltransferase YrrM
VKILFRVAESIGGNWLDIGGHTGWTAAHLAAAGCRVTAVDPMYFNPEFRARTVENLHDTPLPDLVDLWAGTSSEFFDTEWGSWNGIVIDGEHRPPAPWEDSINSERRVLPGGVILFHDTNHVAVQDAVGYLSRLGWNVKAYPGPHGVALCYRDGFVIPEVD